MLPHARAAACRRSAGFADAAALLGAALLIAAALLLVPLPARADWTASATFAYTDQPFNKSGFTGSTAEKPIRHALVQIRDAGTEEVLASGSTNAFGHFSILVRDSLMRDVYAKVLSVGGDSTRYPIRVLDRQFHSTSFSYDSPTIHGHGPGDDVNVPVSITAPLDRAAPAFNILDCLVDAADYSRAAGGTPAPRIPLTAFWSRPYEGLSSYYGDGFSVPNSASYDDGFILATAGKALSLAFGESPNVFRSGTESLSRAWDDGFGLFFLLSCRRYLGYSNPGESAPLSKYSPAPIEPGSLRDRRAGGTDSLTVASVLWQLADDGRGHSAQDDFGRPWPAGSAFRVATRYVDAHDLPSLELFWLGWLELNEPRAADLQALLVAHGAEYAPDSYEFDGSLPLATPLVPGNAPTHHSLYPDSDVDWFSLDAQRGAAYTVGTSREGGSYQGFFWIYDSTGAGKVARVYNSDDRHPSASLVFAPDRPGRYYFRVGHGRSRDPLFGTYDFGCKMSSPPILEIPNPRMSNGTFRRSSNTIFESDGLVYQAMDGYIPAFPDRINQIVSVDTSGQVRVIARIPGKYSRIQSMARSPDGSFVGFATSQFSGSPQRITPQSRAVAGADSSLPDSVNAIVKIGPSGEFRVLHRFGPADGAGLVGNLFPGPRGAVYGVTSRSVEHPYGMLFHVTRTDEFEFLHEFSNLDGEPRGSLYMGPDSSIGVLLRQVEPDSLRGRPWMFRYSPLDGNSSIFYLQGLRSQLFQCRDGNLYFMDEVYPGAKDTASVLRRMGWDGMSSPVLALPPGAGGTANSIMLGADGRFYLGMNVTSGFDGIVVADTLGHYATMERMGVEWASTDRINEAPYQMSALDNGDIYIAGFGGDRVSRLKHLIGQAVPIPVTFPEALPLRGKVRLSYSAVYPCRMEFRVERRAEAGGSWVVLRQEPEDGVVEQVYTDSEALPGADYAYRVGYRLGPTDAWTFIGPARVVARRAETYLGYPTPNPVRATTRLDFEVPARGPVRLDIFNVAGARVSTLVDRVMEIGNSSANWDGRNRNGEKLSDGVYFIRLLAGGQVATRKILLLK